MLTLITLLKQYWKETLLVILGLGLFISMSCGKIRDNQWKKEVGKQQAIIKDLEQKHIAAQVKIAEITGQLSIVVKEKEVIKTKAEGLQKKVDVLIKKYETLDTPPDDPIVIYSSPTEELKVVKEENEQMKKDIPVLIMEIKVDRELIKIQEEEIKLHIQKEVAMEGDIGLLEQRIAADEKLYEETIKQLDEEISRKKTWRTTATTVGGILLLVLLL